MATKSKPKGSKVPISSIISGAALLLALTALFLALRKPQPVATPQTQATVAANAQSFQNKVDQLAQAQVDGQSGTEVHLTPGEVNAAIVQANGGAPVAAPTDSSGNVDVNAPIAPGAVDMESLGQPTVTFDGDEIKGQFLSELGGKKVYVTIAGHIGSKDGYASFEPTEFKVGDLNVPVSLVNDALQKKMLEQRDRLKLPDYVSDVHVENGELVIKQK